ncbi:MAG TPA: hypothetical protein VEL11_16240 [Candidatus Bathyarchaeia archaeon]|nr:hypothetical protein [Candidatus Bathyarchaeia archaeon]
MVSACLQIREQHTGNSIHILDLEAMIETMPYAEEGQQLSTI